MMQCDKCKKNPAVVHIVKIAGGRQTVLNLCGECAKPYEIQMLGGTQNNEIDEMISDILDKNFEFAKEVSEPVQRFTEKEKLVVCNHCGRTLKELKKTSKVGCPHCYEVFYQEISTVINKVQPGKNHIGKVPIHLAAKMNQKKEIYTMKMEMDQRVKNEEYEEAALLRDKIKELEIQMEEAGGDDHE